MSDIEIINPLETCNYCNRNNILADYWRGEYRCSWCNCVSSIPLFDRESDMRNFIPDHGRVSQVHYSFSGDGDTSDLTTSVAQDGSKYARKLQRTLELIEYNPRESKIIKASKKIKSIVNVLGRDKSVRDRAVSLYKEFLNSESSGTRSRRSESIIAGCILTACEEDGYAPTVEMLLEMMKGKSSARQVLHAKNVIQNLRSSRGNYTHYGDIASHFCSNLRLPPYVESAVCDVLELVSQNQVFEGKRPNTVAATAICYVMEFIAIPANRRTIEEVSQVSLVHPSTLSKYVPEMKKYHYMFTGLESLKALATVR